MDELSKITNTLRDLVPEKDLGEVSWLIYCRYNNPLDPKCRGKLMSIPKIRKQVVEFVAEELRKEGSADLAEELEALVTADKRPTRQQWKKIYRPTHAVSKKRIWCCSKPAIARTRRNKPAWMAICRYRIMSGSNRGKFWTRKEILSYNLKRKPIRMDKKRNRRVPVCKEHTKKVKVDTRKKV